MPYKDYEKQKAYQREWVARRRAAYFLDKFCVECGSTDDLELDHVDPALKVSHSIWAWSEERRTAELMKCQVLCRPCHQEKSGKFITEYFSKENSPHAKLTQAQVDEIRVRYQDGGVTYRQLAADYGVDHSSIGYIVNRRIWV